MLFSFPEDARWNPDREAVEFGVGIGEYEGVVRVARLVFRHFLDGSVTPERCLEAYHLQRTRFERIAERKLRLRQLTDDANIEITGRDLRVETRPRQVDGASRGRENASDHAPAWIELADAKAADPRTLKLLDAGDLSSPDALTGGLRFDAHSRRPDNGKA
jgi:uncharacterized protein DUF1488